MKKTKKLLLVALLMFLVAAATGGAYAYWAGTVNAPTAAEKDISINVGTAKEVTTELSLNDTSTPYGNYLLVPSGRSTDGTSNEVGGKTLVEEIIIKYDVSWDEAAGSPLAPGTQGTLSVTYSDVKINSLDTYAAKVKVELWNGSGYDVLSSGTAKSMSPKIVLADASDYAVQIKVTLIEPSNKTEYAAIAGQQITMKLAFGVSVG